MLILTKMVHHAILIKIPMTFSSVLEKKYKTRMAHKTLAKRRNLKKKEQSWWHYITQLHICFKTIKIKTELIFILAWKVKSSKTEP